jgi:SAM-dependent methyltransferase
VADAPAGGPVFEGPSLRLRVAVILAEAIEWVLRHHRLAKLLYAAADLNGRLSTRLLRGEGRECPCCGGRFKRMSQRRLAGFGGICPRCRSHPRHRAIALLLARGDLPGHRLLHFAPEPLFDPVFERLPEIERTTADLYAPADLKLDITEMDLADGSFDLILCSHVLEHVPDDRAAMSELRRVLAPGGRLLFIEHVRGGARLGRRQDRLAGPWRAFAQGCRCNQETLALLERHGLRVVDLARADWRGMPSLVRPLVIGEAA